MSTRSLIGKLNPDQTVTYIYSHFDGYPDGVGLTLLEHYTDPAKVDQLIALGDISSLGEEIGEKHSFNDRHGNPDWASWTTAYGRDRGESDIEPKTVPSLEEYLKATMGTEYWYLFDNGKWRAFTDGEVKFFGLDLAQDKPKNEIDLEKEARS